MSRGAALTGALLITLATPATWPLALAAFLLRGGILLVTLPIVVLPTPVGLGNVVGPTIISLALGSVESVAVAAATVAVVGFMAWLVVGGWLAAALEAEGARIVARDEEVAGLRGTTVATGTTEATWAAVVDPRFSDHRVAGRILIARLIAYVPLGLALAWSAIRVVGVTYDELTVPTDVTTPIALRVLRATPDVIIGVGLAWMVGEVLGAVAARRIALAGDPVLSALRNATATSIRHPLAALARFGLPTLVLVVVLAPVALAAGSAWAAAGAALGERADPIRVLATVVLFVFLWVVGLLLIAVASAWRAAVWTVAEVIGAGDVRGVVGPTTG